MGIQPIDFNENDIKQIFQKDTKVTRFVRVAKRTIKQLIGLGLLYGLFFVLLNSSAYLTRLNYQFNPPAAKPAPIKVVPIEPLPDYPPEVIIEKINVKAPLIMNVQPPDVLNQLHNGVIHYGDTALPGQIGNAVIVGHSSDYPWSPGQYKNVFALLDKLVIGDRITVPYKTQRYVYEVIETKVVKPNELYVLKKTDQPRLTLITCYPVGTTQKRWITVAKLIEGQPIGVQTIEPLLEELPRVR